MKFKSEIYNISTRNRNNRIFSKECIEKMVGKHILVNSLEDVKSAAIPLDKICGDCITAYNKGSDVLSINVELCDVFFKNSNIDIESLYAVPCGEGYLSEENTVTAFNLYGFALSVTTAFQGQTKLTLLA